MAECRHLRSLFVPGLFGMRFGRPPTLARAEHLCNVLMGGVASSCVHSNAPRSRPRVRAVNDADPREGNDVPHSSPPSPSILPSATGVSSAHSLAHCSHASMFPLQLLQERPRGRCAQGRHHQAPGRANSKTSLVSHFIYSFLSCFFFFFSQIHM